jgi:GPH family glycoside/pentoside/hexuronide:cation symporter
MDNIRTYRVLFPVFSIFGILLSLWVFAGTRERIFVPKNYVQRVSFFEGIRQLAGNGHFWLLSISQVLGGLRYCVDSIPNWYCFYVLDSNTMMGLSAIVMGTASVPGMLLAPMLAKTFGKKNVLIFGNLIRVAASVGMFFCLEHVVPLAVLMYVSKLAVGAEFVLTQSMIADIFDLQQWKTGKRLEGFIGQFNKFLIAGFGMLTGLIMPYFYQQYGLGTDYNVLREAEVHMPIFRALIVATTLSCLLSVIPLLFYRLTGRQQKQMMEELAARAAADNGGESA